MSYTPERSWSVFKLRDGVRVELGTIRATNKARADTKAYMLYGSGSWAEEKEYA